MSDTHPAIRAWQRLTGNLRRSPAVPIYAAGDALAAALEAEGARRKEAETALRQIADVCADPRMGSVTARGACQRAARDALERQ